MKNLLGRLLPQAIILSLAVSLHAVGEARPPGIVMIISDDQAWTDFGFMGHEEIRTPRLDRLAGEGFVFSRGYVPGSLCRCSLATLVTGLYPHQHGITSNDPPPGTDRHGMLGRIRAAETLPHLLAGKGYLSLQTGKWWEGSYQLGGFTHGMTHGDTTRGGRHGDEGLKIGREGLAPVRDFLEACEDHPFFIWYAPFLPHTPHNPPERLLAKYRREGKSEFVAKYHAMCEWFDETCGELLDIIDGHDAGNENAPRTLVLFVTDNGWIQREDKGGYAERSKRSPYDGGLRTPIILRQPGVIPVGRDDSTPVLSLDLVTTALAAARIPAPPAMPGIDLHPLAAGAATDRAMIFGEVFSHDAADIERPGTSLLYRWCVTADSKLILPSAPDESPELYDITIDPFERKDLASERPDDVRTLAEEINRWWTPEDMPAVAKGGRRE